MAQDDIQKPTVISLISASVTTIVKNRAILLPFCWIAFLQLLCLEVIYFMPREPLMHIFGPVISKLWGQVYLHYPVNLELIPRLFQYVQIPLFIFFSSLCVGTAIALVAQVNQEEKISVKAAFGQAFSRYIFIVVAALLSFGLILLLSEGFDRIVERALQIRSTSGKLYILKRIVLDGAPFVNLFLSVISTTVFAFLLPVLVIGQEKIVPALVRNFKLLFRSPFTVFGLVLLPSLLYVPVLILRSTFVMFKPFPDITLLLLILSIIVIVFIDAVVNTGITLLYLIKKEEEA